MEVLIINFPASFKLKQDLKVKSGTPINSFNGTGGTVRFTGEGDGEYYGNVQFHNVIVDADAELKISDNNDYIKISGNFTNNSLSLDNEKGTINFNGTTPQTIYSASSPASTNTLVGNLVVSNPTGVTLQTDLGVKTSFTYNSGGYLNIDNKNFYVNGAIYAGALPVELSSFSATTMGSSVKLTGNTATEVNNYGFDVERSVISNGERNLSWETIGFVSGNGNSNSPKSYSFEDKTVTSGKYSYRLKQIDNDGQFEYSKTIEVNFGTPNKFELSQNYPNPFNPATTIRFNLTEAQNVKLVIYDIIGQEIVTLVNEFKESGVYTINFDASELNSGVYVYRLEAGDFVQTRKMNLIK